MLVGRDETHLRRLKIGEAMHTNTDHISACRMSFPIHYAVIDICPKDQQRRSRKGDPAQIKPCSWNCWQRQGDIRLGPSVVSRQVTRRGAGGWKKGAWNYGKEGTFKEVLGLQSPVHKRTSVNQPHHIQKYLCLSPTRCKAAHILYSTLGKSPVIGIQKELL